MSSSPASPPLSTHSDIDISSDAIAAAAERRTRQQTPLQTPAQIMADHEKRQSFRRLIEPGIMRPNSYATAMDSLKVPSASCLSSRENLSLVFLRRF